MNKLLKTTLRYDNIKSNVCGEIKIYKDLLAYKKSWYYNLVSYFIIKYDKKYYKTCQI